MTRLAASVCLVGVLFSIGACTSLPWNMPQPDNRAEPSMPVPPGYYRVNPGDALDRIAAGFGQRPDDVVRWNGLASGTAIVSGQLLRVAPPVTASERAAPDHDKADAHVPDSQRPSSFIWPAQGQVVQPFVAGKSHGVRIDGMPGAPVNAVASGRVVYAGTTVAAYGPLVIIKHDDGLITAYGHDGKLLVKDNDIVKQGQVIAEMGVGKYGRGVLQFEVRRNGAEVDPLSVLPAEPARAMH
ncbi:peptidoglycan DD-metalloendopeptidase family protein [Burkholderia sp. 4701]|nr:peptidoglycan DD-metalloendopeptidase family protein [Burkholderia sp. 4701]MXN83681.1 peptidoglycan DD-metalloendopeptidase family protein [Burkholderia sp. 4812]